MSFASIMEKQQARESAREAAKEAVAQHGGDSEIKSMLEEFDLLDLIRSDTGETGRNSGDRIDFKQCPICTHNDCFSFYPDSKSWTCFSDSNQTGYEGGTALEYYKATRTDDNVEAVKWLREQTGHPYEKGNKTASDSAESSDKPLLPGWESIKASEPPSRNEPLIDGILRRGHVGLLAGKGKSGKSWALIMLAASVSLGKPWLGHNCKSGNVLFIDPEIDHKSLDNRFAAVCRAVGIDAAEIDEHVRKWALRGVEKANMQSIIHDLKLRCSFGDFALVIIYSSSVFVEGDENSSVDIRKFAAKVLQIATITGASVMLVHHYGKGDAGNRDAGDRARGSSVWLDFPDATMFLTETFPPSGDTSEYLEDGARAFVLESGGLREFPPMEPERIIYTYPLHRVDKDGITDGWKPRSSQQTGGRITGEKNKAKSEDRARRCELAIASEFIAQGIGRDGIPGTDAAEIIAERIGESVKPATLKKYIEASEYFDVYQKSKQRWFVVSKRLPQEPPPKLIE